MIASHRVWAYILRHLYEIVATFDRKLDIFFWPTIDLLVFGLLSVYIQKINNAAQAEFAGVLIGGIIFWSLVYSTQRDISVSLLEDAWSRNLYNLFSTPLTVGEIMVGTLLLSFFKALLTAVFTTFLAWLLFGFNLFSLGPFLVASIVSIFVFGWAFGFITASLIFRFGTKVQIFAWSLIALIYPISGVFYPVSVLPKILSVVARFLPVSYVFESFRTIVVRGQTPPIADLVLMPILNVVYLILGIVLFIVGFRNAKARGWFIHPS